MTLPLFALFRLFSCIACPVHSNFPFPFPFPGARISRGLPAFDGGKAAEAEQTVIAAAGGKTAFDLLLLVDNPMLWDDETPNLYDLTIAVQAENGAEDVTRKKIGIRQITISADEPLPSAAAATLVMRRVSITTAQASSSASGVSRV